jgi:hypothetical protein
MLIKGVFFETLLKNPAFLPSITKKEEDALFSITDAFFDPTNSFIFGAPSAHLYIRNNNGRCLLFSYLDLKSTTFSFNPVEATDPTGGCLRCSFPKSIWDELRVYRYEGMTIDQILDDLSFFSGLNIYIMGYASNDPEIFNEITEKIGGFNVIFEDEEVDKVFSGISLLNRIAKESQFYQHQTSHYIVPTVGVEGLELWVGTNSTFYVHICESRNASQADKNLPGEEEKSLLKFLFNIVFLRICLYLSKRFDIPYYTVSRIERAFIIEGKDEKTVSDVLSCIRTINRNAADFFREDLLPISFKFSGILHSTLKKYQQISTFYDESNFVYLTISALTDDTSEYKVLFESLFHQNINKLIESLLDIVRKVDKAIETYLNRGSV